MWQRDALGRNLLDLAMDERSDLSLVKALLRCGANITLKLDRKDGAISDWLLKRRGALVKEFKRWTQEGLSDCSEERPLLKLQEPIGELRCFNPIQIMVKHLTNYSEELIGEGMRTAHFQEIGGMYLSGSAVLSLEGKSFLRENPEARPVGYTDILFLKSP